MITFAKKKYSNGKSSYNISFIEGSAESIQVDSPVDIIVSFTALHWVEDHQNMLKKFRQNLSPKGKILLQFAGKGNAKSILNIVSKIIAKGHWKKYFLNFSFPWFFYDTNQYKTWLKAAGFSIIDLRLVTKNMEHSGIKGLKSWINSTWLAYTQRIPESERNDFINEIVTMYCKKHCISNERNKITTKMVRLQVLAKIDSVK